MEVDMQKKLYRSRKFRVLGGVAGGLAEYFNLDPILMRIIFVLITLYNGIGILLYIVLWIVVEEEPFESAYQFNPEENKESEKSSETFSYPIPKKNNSGRIIIGVVLIAIGFLFFADRYIPSFCFEDMFPIAIIAIGLALIWNSIKK